MRIFGVDFTSRPSQRKPITCVRCTLNGLILRAEVLERWVDYEAFEAALAAPGPWVAGLDFPFGLSRRFIETIGWPASWDGYVAHVAAMSRKDFRTTLEAYKEHRPAGDKEHRRAIDKTVGSISPQKLYGTPVGLMFFEGAPRVLASGATIPHLRAGDAERIVLETYPGVLARALIGKRSYKNDDRSKQTLDQREARSMLVERLIDTAARDFGVSIEMALDLEDDPGADNLDALLCAVQAAWAWIRRDAGYGASTEIDPLEGCIAGPHLSST